MAVWRNPGRTALLFGPRTAHYRSIFAASAQLRAAAKKSVAGKYSGKVQSRAARKEHVASNPMPRSELEDLFLGS